ncbi:hypothetical protein GPECTOR_25g368 [Gonium pectorale]|uniref:TRP C-terminal domain-containing protein n=1 Tax=Gonium pectorale TaxID=33097 RepID=A0A150GG43_GONPE|nr:hypothetical protein GPECTOR_25g368 [Gonium pectorale]|eukprot:KXZ48784.1 hypothetical protein GPECTOR_25g368 [Gonium pectorale]
MSSSICFLEEPSDLVYRVVYEYEDGARSCPSDLQVPLGSTSSNCHVYLELRFESRPLPRRRRILLQRTGVVSNTFPPVAPPWSLGLWVDALSVEDVPERRVLHLADGSVAHKSYFDVKNGAFVTPGPPVIGWRWKHGSLGTTDGYMPSIFPELTATSNGNGINATYQLTYQLTDGFYSFPAPTRFAVLHVTSSPPLLLYLQLGSSVHPANMTAILLQRVEGDAVWTVARLAADSPEVLSGQRHLVFRDVTSRETWAVEARPPEARERTLFVIDPSASMGPMGIPDSEPASTPPLEGRTDPPSAPADLGFGPPAELPAPTAPTSPPAPLLPVACRLLLIGFGAGSIAWSAPQPDSGGGLPQPAGLTLRTASLSCWSGNADDGGSGSGNVPVRVAAGGLLAPLLEASGVELVSVEDRRYLGKGSFATNDKKLIQHWGVSFLGVRHLTLVDSVVEEVPLSPYGALVECRSCGEVALRNVTVRHLSPPAPPATAPGSGGGDGDGGGGSGRNAHYWRGAIALHNVTSAELDGFTCAHVTGAFNWACVLLDVQEVAGHDAARLVVSRSVMSHNSATSPPHGVWDSVVISRSNISHNTAAAGHGGAMHFGEGNVGELRLAERTAIDHNKASMGVLDGGSSLSYNTAAGRGGALLCNNFLARLTLLAGSAADGNTAGADGGFGMWDESLMPWFLFGTDSNSTDERYELSARNGTTILVAGNSSISGNTAAGGDGGAISAYRILALHVTDGGRVDGNVANSGGSVLSVATLLYANISGRGSSMSGNRAAVGSAALAVSDYLVHELRVQDGGRADSNWAAVAPALLSCPAAGGIVVRDGGSVSYNTAEAPADGQGGGAVRVTHADSVLIAEGGTFSHNTVRGASGGALFVVERLQHLTITGRGSAAAGNAAPGGHGGFLAAGSLGVLDVSDGGALTSNTARDNGGAVAATASIQAITIRGAGTSVSGNIAQVGGAISVPQDIEGDVFVQDGASVEANLATARTGGFLSVGRVVQGTVRVAGGSRVCRCAAALSGGAVFIQESVFGGVVVSDNATMCHNRAEGGPGGAVYSGFSIDSVLVARGGALEGNTAAAGPGGAVGAAGLISSVSLVDGGRVTGNTASGNAAPPLPAPSSCASVDPQLSRACALLSMLAPCTPDDDGAEVATVTAAATGPRVGALIDVAPTHMRLEAFPEQLRPGTAFSISVRLYNGLNQPIQRDTLPFTVTLSMAPVERPASLDSRSSNATLPPPNGTAAPRPWRDASVAYLDPGSAAGGSLSVPVVGALATWPFLTVRGWPGRYVVAFAAASAADPGLYQIEPLRVEVDLGRCQPGEALDLTWTQLPGSQPSWLSCSRCSRGRFTLWRDQRPSLWEFDQEDYMAAIRNASVAAAEAEATCLPCPDRSSCLGGAVLVPVSGAWHSAPDSALFHRCPREEACGRGAGGDAWVAVLGVSPAVLQLYPPPASTISLPPISLPPISLPSISLPPISLAIISLPTISLPTIRATSGDTSRCPVLGLNAALAVLTFLGGVALVLYTSYTNLQDSYAAAEEGKGGEEPASEFLKVAILHAQFYVIITRLPVAYPDVINRLQAFVGAATGAESTVAFAYSCFLPGLDSGGQARVQQLGALLVPAAVVAASVALWGTSRAAAAAAAVAAAMAAAADGDGEVQLPAGFEDLDEKLRDGMAEEEKEEEEEEEEGEEEREQEEEHQAEVEQEDTGGKKRGSVDESVVIHKQLGFVFVVALSILYPGWAQAALSVFSCYHIDDGHSGPFPDRQQATWRYGYWVRDMAQECYSGTHLALYMPVGVAAVALVCLMPPLTSFVLLYRHRNELGDPAVRQRYGFLYLRYKPRFYWWESVLMLEELVLVAVEVFGRALAVVSHQILLMLAVFIVLSLVNMACAPTKSRLIGLLEFLSLGVLSLTVTCSLYFVVGEPLSPEVAGSVGVLILLINVGLLAVFLAFLLKRSWRTVARTASSLQRKLSSWGFAGTIRRSGVRRSGNGGGGGGGDPEVAAAPADATIHRKKARPPSSDTQAATGGR